MKGDFKTKVTPGGCLACAVTAGLCGQLILCLQPQQDVGRVVGPELYLQLCSQKPRFQSREWKVCGITDAPADCRKAPSSS